MHNTQDMHNSSTHNFTQYMVRMPKDSPRVLEQAFTLLDPMHNIPGMHVSSYIV